MLRIYQVQSTECCDIHRSTEAHPSACPQWRETQSRSTPGVAVLCTIVVGIYDVVVCVVVFTRINSSPQQYTSKSVVVRQAPKLWRSVYECDMTMTRLQRGSAKKPDDTINTYY